MCNSVWWNVRHFLHIGGARHLLPTVGISAINISQVWLIVKGGVNLPEAAASSGEYLQNVRTSNCGRLTPTMIIVFLFK